LIKAVNLTDQTEAAALAKLRSWADSMDAVRNLLWSYMKSKGVHELS
jgi:hypothetical protein